MSPRFLLLPALLAASLALRAADEAQPSAREMLKLRLAEEAKASQTKPAAGTPPGPGAPAPAANGSSQNPLLAPNATPSAATTNPPAKPENPTVLPKVEVRKGRITELDQQLAKENQQIAREKQNTKPTEVDKALNDPKVAKALSIFGGESSDYRKNIASERVSLMEDEKDLLEAIAHAKTKQEKAELQKQLDALRAERRELEKALR